MQFLLADTFQGSLDRLNGEEQRAAKVAAELQMSPATPSLQCHRLENIKDKNLVCARKPRHPPDLSSRREQRDALLRRPSRSCLRVGLTPEDRNPSRHRCRPVS